MMMSRFDFQQLFGLCRLYFAMQIGFLGISSVFILISRLDWLTQNPDNVINIIQFTFASQTTMLINTSPMIFACAATTQLISKQRQNELVTIAAAGVSPSRFLRATLVFTAMLMVLQFYLTYISHPKDLAWARTIANKINTDTIEANIQPRQFTSFGDDLSIFVQERTSQKTYQGLVVFDKRDPDKTSVLFGEKAFIQEHQGRIFIIIQNGRIIHQPQSTPEVSPIEINFSQYNLDMSSLIKVEATYSDDILIEELGLQDLIARIISTPMNVYAKPKPELTLLVNRAVHVITPLFIAIIIVFMFNELLIQRRSPFITILVIATLLISYAIIFGILRRWSSESFPMLMLFFSLPIIYSCIATQQYLLGQGFRNSHKIVNSLLKPHQKRLLG